MKLGYARVSTDEQRVFVVTWGSYDDHEVFAVFSTQDNADAFCRDWAREKCVYLGDRITDRRVAELIKLFLRVEAYTLDTFDSARNFDGVTL